MTSEQFYITQLFNAQECKAEDTTNCEDRV